jgi:hypothetical protein
MRTNVLWVIVVLIIAALVAWGTVRAVRPAPPDLSNLRKWTLVKLDRADSSPKEIRVYIFKHLSSTWDPYTVEQNKIVAVQDEKPFEYMWPNDRQYAAGWCEVIRLPDNKIEVLLFESPSSMRLVFYNQGRFVFRPDKDELLSTGEITYSDLDHDGVPEFIVKEKEMQKVLRWEPETGFAEVIGLKEK